MKTETNKIDEFAHNYNPLHFYSRLIDLGLEQKEAMRWAQIYEFGVYQEIMDIVENGKHRKESQLSATLQHQDPMRE